MGVEGHESSEVRSTGEIVAEFDASLEKLGKDPVDEGFLKNVDTALRALGQLINAAVKSEQTGENGPEGMESGRLIELKDFFLGLKRTVLQIVALEKALNEGADDKIKKAKVELSTAFSRMPDPEQQMLKGLVVKVKSRAEELKNRANEVLDKETISRTREQQKELDYFKRYLDRLKELRGTPLPMLNTFDKMHPIDQEKYRETYEAYNMLVDLSLTIKGEVENDLLASFSPTILEDLIDYSNAREAGKMPEYLKRAGLPSISGLLKRAWEQGNGDGAELSKNAHTKYRKYRALLPKLHLLPLSEDTKKFLEIFLADTWKESMEKLWALSEEIDEYENRFGL